MNLYSLLSTSMEAVASLGLELNQSGAGSDLGPSASSAVRCFQGWRNRAKSTWGHRARMLPRGRNRGRSSRPNAARAPRPQEPSPFLKRRRREAAGWRPRRNVDPSLQKPHQLNRNVHRCNRLSDLFTPSHHPLAEIDVRATESHAREGETRVYSDQTHIPATESHTRSD